MGLLDIKVILNRKKMLIFSNDLYFLQIINLLVMSGSLRLNKKKKERTSPELNDINFSFD